MCSTIRPPPGAHCSTFFQTSIVGNPRPVASTRTLVQALRAQHHRALEAQSVLEYPPPSRGPMFWFRANKTLLKNCRLVASNKTVFEAICSQHHRDLEAQSVLHYAPGLGAQFLSFLQTRLFCKTLTTSFHQDFASGYLLKATPRSGASLLDYPPPSRGQLFRFPANKAFLESPDQYLPPGLYFRLCAHSSTEISKPKV